MLSQLGIHSNVIEYLGLYSFENQMYMIFEYAEKGDLKRFLEKYRKSIANGQKSKQLEIDSFFQIKVSYDIANGMEYISNLNIIHKDLAARNILLDANYNCKISDFGSCKSDFLNRRPIRCFHYYYDLFL